MRFGILGSFEVADDQGRGVALGAPKHRAVLAILLLHAGEVVSSDRLIDELWGERPPATAAKTLQVYVSNLRKALGDGLLVTRGHGYLLQTAPGQVDLDRFEGLVGEGRQALGEGDAQRASDHFAAKDAAGEDRIELWGRRIGRGLSLAGFIALAIYLYLAHFR